jgi:peptidoglycan/xylan/chitin deacetylase (PgdA/CDA1 family)
MDKKQIMADYLNRVQLFNVINCCKIKSLFVVNYHRLYSGQLQTQFDENVFGISVDMFENHLKFFKKNFDIISEQDLLSMSLNGKIHKKCVLLTFDDGYIDNYQYAFPLLKSYNIPAIFFIATEAIERRRMGWWDIASYLIKKSTEKEIIIGQQKFQISHNDQRQEAIFYSKKLFTTTPFPQYKNLIKKISDSCRVAFPQRTEQDKQLMTWEQLNELSRNNIAIGSHTHSHRVLSTLDENEQFNELKKSKQILEQRINTMIQSLSYPVGGYPHFTDHTKSIAQKAGYKICFSHNTGINRRTFDTFNIKRFSPSKNFNILKGQLSLPSIFLY